MEIVMEEEAELDEDFAQKLIKNVIHGLSDGEHSKAEVPQI